MNRRGDPRQGGQQWTSYKLGSLLATLMGCWLSASPAPAQPQLQPEAALVHELGSHLQAELRRTPEPHFVVRGLPTRTAEAAQASPQDFFDVRVQSDLADVPSLLGRYQYTDDGLLSFTPRYPLRRGVAYYLRIGPRLRAEFTKTENSDIADSLVFQLPLAPRNTPTSVVAVYPSSDRLPENLLKFYLHFSAPMSRGQAYEHIRLFAGTELVEKPFLELGEELWDGEQQRFTLLIHPGRIKLGLRSRDEGGPALTAGQDYTLQINSAWSDAQGFPLKETFEKKFTAIPRDELQLNPERWKIEAPQAGGLEPVQLRFDEPLDHAMLVRVLQVKHRDGALITGKTTTAEHETEWRFTPAQAWKTGTYHIEVATILEDLCGNSLAKPFEVDMQIAPPPPPAARIAIEFIVK